MLAVPSWGSDPFLLMAVLAESVHLFILFFLLSLVLLLSSLSLLVLLLCSPSDSGQHELQRRSLRNIPQKEERILRKTKKVLIPLSLLALDSALQVVVSILDTSNSSYLAPFNVLSERIKEGSVEANNNLKFLESITAPCENVSMTHNSPRNGGRS